MARLTWGALAVACLTSPLAAQDTTGTPFRAGQWAMDFAVAYNATGLGVLRFTTPTRAWLLDASVFGGWSRSRARGDTSLVVSGAESRNGSMAAAVLVGQRGYRALGRRAQRMLQGGVRVGGSHDVRNAGAVVPTRYTNSNWFAGLEGGVGATVLLTRDVGLGGLVTANAGYTGSRGRTETASREVAATTHGFTAAVGLAQLRLTLFF